MSGVWGGEKESEAERERDKERERERERERVREVRVTENKKPTNDPIDI